MPVRDLETTAPRVSWRRRGALAVGLAFVAVVVWRFAAVLMHRAAVQALRDSGWTLVLEDPPVASSTLIDRIAAHLGQTGAFVSGMLGREPEIVEIRIFDSEAIGSGLGDISWIERLPELQRLSVQRELLSASDVDAIGSVRTLTELTIASDSLTDESLAALADLSRLRSLTIVSQRVTDAGLAQLSGLESLTSLDLQSTRAAGANVNAFHRLETLALGPFTGNDELRSVAQLPELKTLVLTDSRISDVGLLRLRTLSSLETLHLSGPHTVTDDGLTVLGDFGRLVRLELHGQHFSFAGLRPLADAPRLEQLELRGRGLDDAGLDRFVPPPSLKTLTLHYTSISDEGFERFENRCPGIDLWR